VDSIQIDPAVAKKYKLKEFIDRKKKINWTHKDAILWQRKLLNYMASDYKWQNVLRRK